ncbi:hypothetical protein [Romboutsia sp.]|uniref:hypothetical protein n=1 Tax=Romboutsia sp. TaxID=1965302 RepID=UPI003F3B94B9
MKKQLEIDYSFGYVYDKSKLIIMYPVGTNVMDLEEYEMEVEVAFLEDGIETAFEESDIKEANETMKPLEMFLMKPNKIIPFVTSIKNEETKEELTKLMDEFDEEHEIKENYIKKGYEIKDVYHVFQNVASYVPKENLETLNILKIEKAKFDMDSFLKTIKENLDEAIETKKIPVSMVKSDIANRLYIKADKGEPKNKYVVFAVDINTYSKGILCADKSIVEDEDADMGDLEILATRDAGYLIEENEGYITFKVANYNSETPNNREIAQIVDYSGIYKTKMIEFVNKFIK